MVVCIIRAAVAITGVGKVATDVYSAGISLPLCTDEHSRKLLQPEIPGLKQADSFRVKSDVSLSLFRDPIHPITTLL